MAGTRIFVPPEKLHGERATLDADDHRHLVKVLRLAPGANLRIFDGTGTEIEARIESIGKASVDVALGARKQIPSPACAITLLQSLPRGERMDIIVQKTTELGVLRIVPVLSEHGMVKPPAHRQRRWQTIAEEAARQCGRADVPVVAEPVALGPALSRLGPDLNTRLLVWEGERNRSLRAALASGPRQVCLCVGPEGGFSSREVALCAEAAFETVGLGPRILRAETAAIVTVALAQAAAGGLE
jgi:16S rRNA (uracil1498-N3)-methyltransferase